MKIIEEVGDKVGLFLCQGRMAGDAEFLRMNQFGDGQGQAIPISITPLFVRRDRIMNLRLHTVVAEILLQFVTTGR